MNIYVKTSHGVYYGTLQSWDNEHLTIKDLDNNKVILYNEEIEAIIKA